MRTSSPWPIMQETNKSAEYTISCNQTEAAGPWKSSQQVSPASTRKRGWKTERRYQRGLSKQRMKDPRYRHSGTTQRNGITATCWEMTLVVASNITEAQAGRPIQSKRIEMPGFCAGST